MAEITYAPGVFSPHSDEPCFGAREKPAKPASWHRRHDIEDIILLKEALSTYLRARAAVDEWPAEADRTLEKRFQQQADKWQQETQHLSSPSQRMMHPSYQAIMGMANDNRDEIVDLLLRDMQQNRREWFWALSYLTHENPIERKNAGRLDKMIEAWVRWGQQRRGRR